MERVYIFDELFLALQHLNEPNTIWLIINDFLSALRTEIEYVNSQLANREILSDVHNHENIALYDEILSYSCFVKLSYLSISMLSYIINEDDTTMNTVVDVKNRLEICFPIIKDLVKRCVNQADDKIDFITSSIISNKLSLLFSKHQSPLIIEKLLLNYSKSIRPLTLLEYDTFLNSPIKLYCLLMFSKSSITNIDILSVEEQHTYLTDLGAYMYNMLIGEYLKAIQLIVTSDIEQSITMIIVEIVHNASKLSCRSLRNEIGDICNFNKLRNLLISMYVNDLPISKAGQYLQAITDGRDDIIVRKFSNASVNTLAELTFFDNFFKQLSEVENMIPLILWKTANVKNEINFISGKTALTWAHVSKESTLLQRTISEMISNGCEYPQLYCVNNDTMCLMPECDIDSNNNKCVFMNVIIQFKCLTQSINDVRIVFALIEIHKLIHLLQTTYDTRTKPDLSLSVIDCQVSKKNAVIPITSLAAIKESMMILSTWIEGVHLNQTIYTIIFDMLDYDRKHSAESSHTDNCSFLTDEILLCSMIEKMPL
ncbi:hypothetical protein GJ496_004996 [Pomphorhynchus laevis]|nr:hypothetical protein GJ496_004996 [Pomphorhynchus laevis]